MRYAQALADWADAGGYEAETLWDVCTVAALGVPYEKAQWREVRTLSGGEQKRLVLEALLRGPDEVLLLDEPDNYLDVPGKRWLEEQLRETPKTVLLVSHDRELLDRAASRIATLEPGAAGSTAWVHPGRFSTYHEARAARFAKLEELRRRWDEEHQKLKDLVQMYKIKAAYNDGHGQPLPGGQDPAGEVRGGRSARGAAAATERPDAAAGGPHRQAGGHLRAARADRADEAVRPRGLVRRAGRGARLQRLRQVALPAAAGGRRQRPGRRAPAGGRRRHRRRSSTPAGPGSARGCGRAGSPRPTSTRG